MHKKRVVVLDGEQRPLKDFRAKVCRETEMAVEHFDHFCPWVGNVRVKADPAADCPPPLL